MEWLPQALSVDAPKGTRLDDWLVEFRGGDVVLWWVAATVVLLGGGLVILLYAKERGKVGGFRRGLMAGLRVAAIVLVVLLLLRPVLVAEFRGEVPRDVVLLLDNSQSMKQPDARRMMSDRMRVAIAAGLADPKAPVSDALSESDIPRNTPKDPTREQLVRAALANQRLKLLDELGQRGPVRMMLFGRELRSAAAEPTDEEKKATKDPRAALLAGFKATDNRTALADNLRDLLTRGDRDLPAAIVILTDGRDNASKYTLDEAAEECRRLGIPLQVYGVGATEFGKLELKRDVAFPEMIFAEDSVSIPVHWRSHGIKQGTAVLSVLLGGKVVAEKEVPVREGDDLREELTFTPEKPRERETTLDLVTRIRLKDADAPPGDTEIKRPVRLLDRKVKVLYVEYSPRWEYKFLMIALLRDRRVDARVVLLTADSRTIKAGPPYLPQFPGAREELFEYDLLILGDIPATAVKPEQMEWVRDFVKEGGGLVMIAGRQHAPADFHGKMLAEVLPVEFSSEKTSSDPNTTRSVPVQPVLTPLGERTEMLALADSREENLKIWNDLPGFHWHAPVTKLKPGAVALLVHPRLTADEKPMPLMASHHYGKGRVLFLGTEETWRWRHNARDKYFARFWGQVIYQMGLPHLVGHPKRAQFTLDRAENILGKPADVYARLFEADYRPMTRPEVTVTLERLDEAGQTTTETVTFNAVAGQPGEYRALLDNGRPGTYVLKLEDPPGVSPEFRVVLPPQHELEVEGLAEEPLRRAAEISGGKFYREENLHSLAGNITPRFSPFVERREVLLWQSWLVWAVFVGLLTAEWLCRKFSDLS